MPHDAPKTHRDELSDLARKARAAARELEAMGLYDTECRRLADRLERALQRAERPLRVSRN